MYVWSFSFLNWFSNIAIYFEIYSFGMHLLNDVHYNNTITKLLVLQQYCKDWSSNCFYSLFQAYVVLGQFLVFRKDEELFMEWLKDSTGANKKQQADCFGCLKEWCDQFL